MSPLLCSRHRNARDAYGVARPQDWQTIAFKGGSEPGVLNLTTHLKDAAGRTYCVVATWNNPEDPVDEETRALFYRDILLGLLK